jgi:hypothetical protein
MSEDLDISSNYCDCEGCNQRRLNLIFEKVDGFEFDEDAKDLYDRLESIKYLLNGWRV